jgi:hypothetical protein
MEFVYRFEIIWLELVNIIARSVEGGKDHAAEVGTPVVPSNRLGVGHFPSSILPGSTQFTGYLCMRPMLRAPIQPPKREPVERCSTRRIDTHRARRA